MTASQAQYNTVLEINKKLKGLIYGESGKIYCTGVAV